MKRLVIVTFLGLFTLIGLPGIAAAEPEPGCEPLTFRVLPGQFNNCLAQRMWKKGRYQQALKMFESAAAWASRPAQRLLGIVYFNGENVPRNRPLGLAWLNLGSQAGDKFGRQLYEAALLAASDAEKEQMKEELARLAPKYSDEITVPRAARRFKWEMAELTSKHPGSGAGICLNMDGFEKMGNSEPTPSGCSMSSQRAVMSVFAHRYDQYVHGMRDADVIVWPMQKIP